MTRLVLVGCGKNKQDLPDGRMTLAKNLYTSTYFEKKRQWAVGYGDDWYILSAKHRLLDPDRMVEYYDVSMGDLDEAARKSLAREIMGRINNYIENVDVDEIVVLAGKSYLEHLRPELEFVTDWYEIPLRFPFDDTSGIFEQMGWLTTALETGEPFPETGGNIDG